MKPFKKAIGVATFWLLWPALFIYLRGTQRARVLLVSGGQALLIRDHSRIYFDDERWTVPGGGLHRNESPATAAVRELQEELGIALAPQSLQPLGSMTTGSYGLRYKAHFFWAEVPSSTPFLAHTKEVADAAWHSLASLDEPRLKTEARQALRLYAAR